MKTLKFKQFILENNQDGIFTYHFMSPVIVERKLNTNHVILEDVLRFLSNQGFNLIRKYANELEVSERNLFNNMEALEQAIEDEYGSIDQFYSNNFDDYDSTMTDEEYKFAKDEFNEDDMSEYFDEKKIYGIVSMKMIDSKEKSLKHIFIEMKTEKSLSNEELENVKDYLAGQYSDGFGEGLEQRPFIYKEDELTFESYIHTWFSKNTCKDLKVPIREFYIKII